MAEEQKLKGNEEVLGTLRRLPLFRIFSEEDLLRMQVHDAAKIKLYRPGEIIIERGNYEKTFYVLLSGEVKIIKSGREMASCTEQGAIFGEMSFILGKGRTATVQAVGETACLEINMGCIDFLEVAEREEYLSKFYRFLAPLVEERLGSSNARKVEILSRIRELEEEIEAFARERRVQIELLRGRLHEVDATGDDEDVLRQILDRRF